MRGGQQQQQQGGKPEALHSDAAAAAVNSDFFLRLDADWWLFKRCPGCGALLPAAPRAYFGTSFGWRCRGNRPASPPAAAGVGGRTQHEPLSFCSQLSGLLSAPVPSLHRSGWPLPSSYKANATRTVKNVHIRHCRQTKCALCKQKVMMQCCGGEQSLVCLSYRRRAHILYRVVTKHVGNFRMT